jgi:hypothetical protein
MLKTAQNFEHSPSRDGVLMKLCIKSEVTGAQETPRYDAGMQAT